MVKIEIYADEIITPHDFNNKKKNIIGIGCLFVPEGWKEILLNNLINARCLFEKSKTWHWDYNKCPFCNECNPEWHKQNMCEIHNVTIRKSESSNSKIKITKKWLNYLYQNRTPIYFNILYLDLDVLNIDCFGTRKEHENIYNRFFRTVIDYGVKAFFGNYERVIIKKVYQDNGNMKNHSYFPYLNLKKLDDMTSKNITIENAEIQFIESDHKYYLGKDQTLVEEAHIIQYIDLIIGTISQNIFYLSNDVLKKEMAMIVRPLVAGLTNKPYDKNSIYNYYGKQKISFFPKEKITHSKEKIIDVFGNISEIFKKSQFYTNREIEMPLYNPTQESLNKWC